MKSKRIFDSLYLVPSKILDFRSLNKFVSYKADDFILNLFKEKVTYSVMQLKRFFKRCLTSKTNKKPKIKIGRFLYCVIPNCRRSLK